MSRISTRVPLALALWSSTAAMHVCATDLSIITHPTASYESLSRDDVVRLYLGKIRTTPDGRAAMPVYPPTGSPLRLQFDAHVLDRRPAEVKAYWAQQMFTGRGKPPPELADESAILNHVAEHPGSIGFISTTTRPDGVKVVLTLEGAP